MKKRVLSMFMALMLCLTLLPTAALAEETEGTAQTPPAVEKAADPANGKAEQESQPAETKQENQSAEQEEQQEDSAAKQAVATVQALIDALPDAAELDGMNDEDAMAVYEAFQTACDAYYDTLTEEQQAQLKNTEKLAALSEWFNSQVAPLENSGDIYPDTVDADGNIVRRSDWSRSGLICEDSNGDASFTDAQFYVVKENGSVTIRGNLTIGGNCGLILCQGATLTVEGALICSGSYSIYGQSDGGAYAGRLVVKNSLDDGAAIRSSENGAPTLSIYSGELEIYSGNSDKLVDGVKLSSKNKVHAAALGDKQVLLAAWSDVSSIKGTSLVLEYCGHSSDYERYVDNGNGTHHMKCDLCGFEWTKGEYSKLDHEYDKYEKINETYHKATCVCGYEASAQEHKFETGPDNKPVWTSDGKGHVSGVCACGYSSGTVDAHDYDEFGTCKDCGFKPAFEDSKGNLYEYNGLDSIDALNEAIKKGETSFKLVNFAQGEGADAATVEAAFALETDANVTLDMNGKTLKASGGTPVLTVSSGALTVTGDAAIIQGGASQETYKPAIEVTGGSLVFEGDLTAQGGKYGKYDRQPAVEVTGGTLRLKAGDVLNGGVSVAGSTTYANVNALLGENLAFAKKDDTSTIVKGDVKSISENVTVVAHTHDFKRGSDGKYVCACGYTCPHNEFENGVCKICGNGCAHTNVGDDGVCRNCKAQMLVKIENGGNTTYSTDFKAAMNAAVGGTKITLLADVSIQGRTGISGDNTTVTLDLNEHKITSGWLDVGGKDTNGIYTACTLKIIGKGSYEPPMYCGIITVDLKATLDLSEWEGGTISSINISDNSNYEAATREAAVIVGPKAGTIGNLSFGNNQLDELKKTKLSGGSFNEIWVAGFGPVKLGELLADGYAFQNEDGPYVKYETTLQGASIFNVKVVKCPHGGAEGFDNNSTNCPYCNAPAVAETALNNGEGSSLWRRFANLQTAIDADRAGGAEFKLLTDVTGDYTIDGTKDTALDLNGHSIKGTVTVKGIKGDRITTTLSNTQNTTTASIDKVVACDGAELAGSKYPAVIGELTLAEGATWKTILNGTALGYEVLNADGTHKWYAQDDVKVSQLNNVIINRLPITSKTLYLKVGGKNLNGSSPKVERGTTVQLCAGCNAKDVTVTFSILKKGETTPITLLGNDVQYTTVGTGTTKFYVAEYAFNDVGSYTISFTATKDGYTVTSTPKKLTVTKPNLSNAVITFRSSNESTYEPYNSTTTAPGFTVTYNGKTLKLGVDYTASGTASSAGVSTQTLTIKAVEGSDYTGSKTAEWRIVPHKAKVEVGDVIKAYDGTTDLPDGEISLVSAAGSAGYQAGLPLPLSEGNGFELTDAKYDSANASETEKNISFTVKLTDTNYTFEDGTTEKAFTLNGAELEDKSFKINKAAAPTNIPTGTLNIINGTHQTYTYDFSKLLPELSEGQYGTISYGNQPAISLVSQSGYYYDGTIVEFKNGVLILAQFYAKDGEMTGQIGTVKVNVTTTNYENFQLTLVLNAINQIKPTPDGEITASNITYGQALSDSSITGKMKDPNTGDEVKGTFTWTDDTIKPDANDRYEADWTFTPAAGYEKYATATGTVTIKVNKAAPTFTAPTAQENLTYTGREQALITASSVTSGGTMQYSLTENGTYSQDIPTGTDAGTYTVWYRVIGDANHNDTAPASVVVRIGQKPLPITGVTAASKPYDGTTNAGITSVTFDGVTLNRGTDYTVAASFDDASVGNGKNVTATVTLMGQAAKNYALEQSSFLTTGSIIKADGGSLKTVELTQKYTDTSEHTYTPDWLGLPGGQTWSYSSEYSVNNGSKATLTKQDIAAANGKLTYAISGGKTGDKITLTLKASCDNYEDFTITLTITLTARDDQKPLTITGDTSVIYGEKLTLTTIGGSGSGAVTYTVTNGTGEATIDSNGVLTPVRIGSVTVTATKAGDSEYNAVTSSPVEITITRATPTGEPAYTKITASGKTLADAGLTLDGGTISLADGKLEWIDDRGNVLPDETVVEANKTYRWRFTPANGSYTTLTGSIELYHKSTSSGGGGSYYAPVVPDMPMLYRGCTGDAVKTLQDKLNTLGYNSGNVDGIFGAKTYAAVTAFQKANSLGVDGIVGKLTWAKLYDATPVNVTPVTTQPMLRTGSRGDAVRKLQELLNALGYDCGSVDGIFGSKTKAAVLAFQKANGLGADGIVGPLTWGKLV